MDPDHRTIAGRVREGRPRPDPRERVTPRPGRDAPAAERRDGAEEGADGLAERSHLAHATAVVFSFFKKGARRVRWAGRVRGAGGGETGGEPAGFASRDRVLPGSKGGTERAIRLCALRCGDGAGAIARILAPKQPAVVWD